MKPYGIYETALVTRLKELEDPQKEAFPAFDDTDWRTLSGIVAREIEYLHRQLADSKKQVTLLRGLVEQSRGSVKFDLNRYEQLLAIKRMVGVEKTAQYIAIEIETNRLSNTLEGIDEALAATEPKP